MRVKTSSIWVLVILMLCVAGCARTYPPLPAELDTAFEANYLIGPDGKVLWSAVGFDEDGLKAALKKAGF